MLVRKAFSLGLVGQQMSDAEELTVAKVVRVRDLWRGAEFGHQDLDCTHCEAPNAKGGLDGVGDH